MLKVRNMTLSDGRNVRIRDERKRLGLTQAQAAAECGVTRGQWVRYENGENKFEGSVLKAFISIGADGQYILSGQYTSVEGTEVTVEALEIGERLADKWLLSFKADLKRTIDQCEDRRKLRVIDFVLGLDTQEFDHLYDALMKLDLNPIESNINKKEASNVVNNPINSRNGTQLNGKKNKVDNRNQSKTSNYHDPQQNSSISVENQHSGSIVGIKNE